jgi:protein-S-isoprenylcysteine O-methyltransferase Ste14
MSSLLKHAAGVLCVLLGVWGVGFIYTAITVPSLIWQDRAETAVAGIFCLTVAIILFRIWNRATGDVPWWPKLK